MSASPALTPVTTPELVTVATLVADDCQLACDVTACDAPLDIDAVAVNCALAPTFGAVPVTDTDETVDVDGDGVVGADVEDVDDEPHAQIAKLRTRALPSEMIQRDIERPPRVRAYFSDANTGGLQTLHGSKRFAASARDMGILLRDRYRQPSR